MVDKGQAASTDVSDSASAADLVAETDTGSRNPADWQGKLITGTALAWSLFQIYYASNVPFWLTELIGVNVTLNSDQARSIHLAFAMFLAATAFPLFKRSSRDRIPWYDWALGLAGVAACLYLVVFKDGIAERAGVPIAADMVMSILGLGILLVATYRSLGLPLVIVSSVFMFYTFFGDRDFIPEVIQWRGASMGKALWHYWMQTEGVFGVALGVSTSMVFLFVLFGSLLDRAGAGNYFIKVSFALLGHLRGGPAKAAVVSSAMTGLISGSSIANTVTTGTFTIPLMKRVGFPAEKAGAVEVASSTNGQLTPPVMGAAAFLMVEYVGISYLDVVRHAFLPAVISYIALVYIVHLEALKLGMQGMERSGPARTVVQRLMGVLLGFVVTAGLAAAVYYGLGWTKTAFGDATLYAATALFVAAYLALASVAARVPDLTLDDPNAPLDRLPELGATAKTGLYFLLPLVVLVWCLMIERFSPGLSAFWATLSMILIVVTQHPVKALFRGQGEMGRTLSRGFDDLVAGLIAGARNMIGIAVATGTAGIIVGTISLTGAHQVMGEFVEFLSGGNLMLMLVFVAVLSLILGMGLPTTANYIVVSSLMAPVIVTVGAKSGLIVPLIAVHMFVFYFGILADDTPPVGLAAFAAAAISRGDPIRTGIQGFAYDIRTAILPFLFLFNTELLLIDVTLAKAVFVFVVAVTAMLLFAAATQGYFLVRNRLWETFALLLIAFTLFRPGYWLDRLSPPYLEAEPAGVVALAGEAGADAKLRLVVGGEDAATGKQIEKTVDLPLGPPGEGAARLQKSAGLELRIEDGKTIVDNVEFGGFAEQQKIDLDWEVRKVLVPAERMPKEVFYIPALLLLAGVVLLQRRRQRAEAA